MSSFTKRMSLLNQRRLHVLSSELGIKLVRLMIMYAEWVNIDFKIPFIVKNSLLCYSLVLMVKHRMRDRSSKKRFAVPIFSHYKSGNERYRYTHVG